MRDPIEKLEAQTFLFLHDVFARNKISYSFTEIYDIFYNLTKKLTEEELIIFLNQAFSELYKHLGPLSNEQYQLLADAMMYPMRVHDRVHKLVNLYLSE